MLKLDQTVYVAQIKCQILLKFLVKRGPSFGQWVQLPIRSIAMQFELLYVVASSLGVFASDQSFKKFVFVRDRELRAIFFSYQ